jgi:membrane-bound lytic murein transglycosylase C
MNPLLRAAPLLLVTFAASAADDFEAFQRQQTQERQAYETRTTDEFEAYRKEILTAFENYRRKAAAVWGEQDATLPDRKRLVEYGAGMTERRTIDFEQGVAKVEIALSPAQAADAAGVAKRLGALVQQVVTEAPDTRAIQDIAAKPEAAKRQGEPVLADLVQTADGRPVTAANAAGFARAVVGAGVQQRTQQGEDGQKRVVASAEFPLIPNHIRVRAAKFEPLVRSQAKRQKLDAKLVFAVMETESAFNPTARSTVPAFGLMQLVPTSGARDAYRHLHNQDRVVSDAYLYDPRNNIELGAAYLNRLLTVYLAGVQDPEARLWCAIAAYNTGPGNVMRAFAGTYRASTGSRADWQARALGKINRMSSEQVFKHLVGNLPYEETRHYVQRVRERMPKYQAM